MTEPGAAEAPAPLTPEQKADVFQDLYARYWADAHGFALRLVNDYASALDVVAEAFADYLRFLDSYRPENPEAVLFTMVRRRAMKVYRQRRRDVVVDYMPNGVEVADDSFSFTPDWSPKLQAALETLTPKVRQAIELRYWGDLRTDEIAKELAISEVAVRKLLSRGMYTLRRRLIPRESGGIGVDL